MPMQAGCLRPGPGSLACGGLARACSNGGASSRCTSVTASWCIHGSAPRDLCACPSIDGPGFTRAIPCGGLSGQCSPSPNRRHRLRADMQTSPKVVQQFFEAQATYWHDVYSGADVFSNVVRRREAIALAWIEGLGLAPRTRALEVGCGAGGLAVK